MDDPLHHGSLEPDGMPFTAMPAMPATTQGLASGGTQLITDRNQRRDKSHRHHRRSQGLLPGILSWVSEGPQPLAQKKTL